LEDIEDIFVKTLVDGEEVEYCFTDGIGNISGSLASLIDKKYDLTQCSAY
jgi:hypothetical protein